MLCAEIRKSYKPVGCAKCILGSVRSYEAQDITAIDKNMMADLPDDLLDKLSFQVRPPSIVLKT